ncbi:MAG: glycine--tRNA ligase [Patescibacteria group bacterium]|nr:glycine--tRNA ligase [Patescibacteria group bacterium]MCL5431719.1 glycine--tRNA ligase [Patescibacteria group bacterium]
MDLMEKIVSLCKRRGFVYPGSEIYGGLSNTWDFGPFGLALRKNIKALWWREFVEKEENILGLDGGIILSPRVWEASGHVENFTDPLVECKSCHTRFRADQLGDTKKCPDCGGQLSEPRRFNGMFRTTVGATEDSNAVVYLRPETAQAIFINFKNIVDSFHPKLPFGIAQIGKAFRNEITAGNFIFRDIEFEQHELEYFLPEAIWEEKYDYWLAKMHDFAKLIGLAPEMVHEREHSPQERSHYSKKTVDLEFDFPFGRKELWGLAYRTDYDLRNHSEKSGVDLKYEGSFPHVIEPSMGVDRTMLAVLCSAYFEDEKRVVLKLQPSLAPYKVAVFPLVANKEELVGKARGIYEKLKKSFMTAWDDRGNIGKRYLSQDEIGTPWCVTVDYQTLEDDTVTIRDRNTTRQERIKVANLETWIKERLV